MEKNANIIASDPDAVYHLEQTLDLLAQLECWDQVSRLASTIEAICMANGTPCDVCRANGDGLFVIEFYDIED